MIYLREIKIKRRITDEITLDIFEGDIKEDKKYWVNYHKAHSVRYFKLVEKP